jgi:hypothetical protein
MWVYISKRLKPAPIDKNSCKIFIKNIGKIILFTIHHSHFTASRIYISEIEVFNRYKLNKTYLINRQKSLNLQT